MTGQFRQSVFGRLGGYDDVNDADQSGTRSRHALDCWRKAIERQAASTSQMGRFETELLATDENVEALVDMNGVWIDKVHDRHPPKMIILDMDSSVSPTHGEQEGTAYNGHFGCTCYHPLSCSTSSATWRDVPCAPVMFTVPTGWRNVLEPVVMRYKERKVRLYFRGDAAFASPRYTNISKPRDYSTSSASKRTRFSSGTLPICLRDLSVARPTMFAVSTPASAIRPDRGTRSAVSWPKWSGTPASWFLASVSSSLICRALPSGWWRSIITVARRSSTSRKARTPSTGPVCHVARFRNNAVRLQLHALAYNLGNFMRTLALPKEVEHWVR